MAWANSTTANHVLENGVCVGKTSPWHAAYLDTPGPSWKDRSRRPNPLYIDPPAVGMADRTPRSGRSVERMRAYETGQIKDIENRTWPTAQALSLIHASKACSRREHGLGRRPGGSNGGSLAAIQADAARRHRRQGNADRLRSRTPEPMEDAGSLGLRAERQSKRLCPLERAVGIGFWYRQRQ